MQNNTPWPAPKVAIVGQGAIGSLIGFKCQKLGYEVQHLVRRQRQQSYCTVTDLAGKTHHLTPNTGLITQPQQFDLLLVPVKAYQVLPVLRQLQSFITPQQVIVLLHNGMGTTEQVKESFPNNPLIAATTSYGALKPDANTLIETGKGHTHFGWLGQVDTATKQAIEPVLSALLPPSYWHQDINLALWKKLAINAVINPLSAIHNVRNGELADHQYQRDISTLCDEIAKVMTAQGYSISSAELNKNAQQVIAATANNYSSMHQDLKFNRKSEIEFITGYVCAKANELNCPVPFNQRLLEQVTRLESVN